MQIQEEFQMEIKRVGVIGGGLMGAGISQVAAQSGYEVVMVEVSEDLLTRARKGVEQSLGRLVEKGTIDAATRETALGSLTGTTKLEDLSGVDLVIEAIVEAIEVKNVTFSELDRVCKAETIFASNTSSLSITEMMRATSLARRGRFVGMHFFNPVPLMKLVEVVRTVVTDENAYQAAIKFAESLGKTVVRTSDSTGFIVNRLLIPYLLDAIRAYESGLASIVDIDNGMKLGCGHPMGPLTLLDFVGLDTTFSIANIMFDEFREQRFAPPPLLKRMVLAGLTGRKTGKGFYDYADPRNPQPVDLLR